MTTAAGRPFVINGRFRDTSPDALRPSASSRSSPCEMPRATARHASGRSLGSPARASARSFAATGAPGPSERPGELLHIDTKRLGRFHQVGKRILLDGVRRSPRAGWHHLHVAIDDHTRIAYCEVLAGQGAEASCAFLGRAVAWFAAEHGIPIERVLTDNGHAYRSHAWRDACARLGIERRRTRPYTPRTNGKAERFLQTRRAMEHPHVDPRHDR